VTDDLTDDLADAVLLDAVLLRAVLLRAVLLRGIGKGVPLGKGDEWHALNVQAAIATEHRTQPRRFMTTTSRRPSARTDVVGGADVAPAAV
jgi:hypothetical protein